MLLSHLPRDTVRKSRSVEHLDKNRSRNLKKKLVGLPPTLFSLLPTYTLPKITRSKPSPRVVKSNVSLESVHRCRLSLDVPFEF